MACSSTQAEGWTWARAPCCYSLGLCLEAEQANTRVANSRVPGPISQWAYRCPPTVKFYGPNPHTHQTTRLGDITFPAKPATLRPEDCQAPVEKRGWYMALNMILKSANVGLPNTLVNVPSKRRPLRTSLLCLLPGVNLSFLAKL